MYWVYENEIFVECNQYVQARLRGPTLRDLYTLNAEQGFRSPRQDEPYGVDLKLTYQINPKHTIPDYYFESAGFTLFSERLIALMFSYDVKAEIFPVTLVDNQGAVQTHLSYYIFHILEGVLEAMDELRSEWTGDRDIGIPRLLLDYSRFEHRPMFLCNNIYVPLIRDDLKRAIQNQKLTGFRFLKPEQYHSGQYGKIFEFDC